MEYKSVQYGNLKTTQVKCPSCGLWQFESDFCECGESLKQDLSNENPPEIRVEIPSWRDYLSKEIKEKVYQRDEYICQYCGVWCYESYAQNPKSVVIDHATPLSVGGSKNIDNLITSCRRCNNIKSDLIFETFEEARNYIKNKINNKNE